MEGGRSPQIDMGDVSVERTSPQTDKEDVEGELLRQTWGCLWREKSSLLHAAVKDSPNYQHSGSSQRPFWHKVALLPYPG